MAPEVIEHKPYDEKADVFSFGVVMWELLTCKVSGTACQHACCCVSSSTNNQLCLFGVNTLRCQLLEVLYLQQLQRSVDHPNTYPARLSALPHTLCCRSPTAT